MTSPQQNLLCHYRYDPLDRLISHAKPQASPLLRFYCKSRLATEIQGALHHSILQHDDQLLAQQQRLDETLDTTLLATDLQRSVLHTLKPIQQREPIAYSAYGHRPPENGLLSLMGFNGERPDPVTGHYLLGNGYRAFNPVLMRFNSPDSLSPFGKGGFNSYAYCLGDPVNRHDPSGHSPLIPVTVLKTRDAWQRAGNALAELNGLRRSAKLPVDVLELEVVARDRSIKFQIGSEAMPHGLDKGMHPETAILLRDKYTDLAITQSDLNDGVVYSNMRAAAEKRNWEWRGIFNNPDFESWRLKFFKDIGTDKNSRGFDFSKLNSYRFSKGDSEIYFREYATEFHRELEKHYSTHTSPLVHEALRIRDRFIH
jgi:RHS repeat-associated protein